MKTIFCVFGTRPEAIKMAPVVMALRERPGEFRVKVVVTAQHRGMLDQVLGLFRIRADVDLDIMRSGQSLTDVTTRALAKLEPVFKKQRPDLVLVHGDTTTTLAATLAAYYQKISVGHVEAGLRSHDIHNPYPEEINRRLTDAVAALHFAPTAGARKNLLREGVPAKRVFVTGNTGVDALLWATRQKQAGRWPAPPPTVRRILNGPFVLITAHRRENFGRPLENFFQALRRAARENPAVGFVYPVHPNPNVTKPAHKLLYGAANIHLLPPLDYATFVTLLEKCLFVVTDSGGLQEEAPALGKPVLVLREVTERPEAVHAGTARVVGTATAAVYRWIHRLFSDQTLYRRMSTAANPFGDGQAASRTVEAIRFHFTARSFPPASFS